MICEYGFRKAVKEDLPLVLQLYKSVIGTPGCVWDEEYPNEETLKEDFEGENSADDPISPWGTDSK